MANYREKVNEIIRIFHKVGDNLVREEIISNYVIVKNAKALIKEPADWKEKPAVYGIYEFQKKIPLFLITSATLDKEYCDEPGVFILTYETLTELPDFGRYVSPSIEDKCAYVYNPARLESLIKSIIIRGY